MQRWPVILLATSLLGGSVGCVTSTTRLETKEVRPLGRIATGLPRSEGTIRAIAWQEGTATVVLVQRVFECPSAEVKEVRRDEISNSRISTAAIVVSAALGGLGAVELLTSDKQSDNNNTLSGLLMIGTGGLMLAAAKGMESDKRKHLPAERVYEVSTPVACKSIAWEDVEVMVGSGQAVSTARTDPAGEATLQGLVLRDRPGVQVDGKEVRDVVVVQSREAAIALAKRALQSTPSKRAARPAPEAAPPKPAAVASSVVAPSASAPFPLPPPGVPGAVPTGRIQDLPPPPPPPP